ncbi:hypothetical protein O1611_g7220 [Lasiodiplodia mahajangana]|uniref:Uncharacterized protein n=1 Tax=Lasiodiplodia mahajangana TaxID=1108764 RepID=A0ACC2JGQ4_9PEZI|nr:hypothetical protein O1611_g7220 [Lasiodiplodia mahajangana]
MVSLYTAALRAMLEEDEDVSKADNPTESERDLPNQLDRERLRLEQDVKDYRWARSRCYETERLKEKFLDFVCPHSPKLVHRNLVKARTKDSGTWLFDHPVFKRWQKMHMVNSIDSMKGDLSKCLWLSGKPGAGKSVLMSAVVDYLFAEKGMKTAVLFFYFDRSLPSSPRDAIASLLRQLCTQTDAGPLPWFLANGLATMKQATPGSKGDTSDTITGIDGKFRAPMPVGDMISDFLSLQQRFDRVYICLDGLEECDDLVALFEFLVHLVTSSTPCRLAISARPQIVHPGITARVGSEDMVVILEQLNAPDIRYYLDVHTMEHEYFADIVGLSALPDYKKKVD